MVKAKKQTQKVVKAATSEPPIIPKEIEVVPAACKVVEGLPKSGRKWKVKQTSRSSSQQRKGVLTHMAKSFDQRMKDQQQKKNMKEFERELIEEKKNKKIEERLRREENQRRRAENEYKNSVYQQLKPEKIKGMSKKQLRSVKKTAVNKFGQVELVNPWGNGADPSTTSRKTSKRR